MKKIKLSIAVILIICFLLGVKSTAGVIGNLPDENKSSTGQITYRVGEKGPNDGKVLNVDASGRHGLEVKTEDELNSITWDTAVLTAKGNDPGWRLPTITELGMLYEHRELIGGFSDEDYWSSSERDVNSAWIQGFRLGDQDRYSKQSMLKVRAVRSF